MLCAEPSPSATVLVVEDESLLRDGTSQQLAALGYRVLAAAADPGALDLLAEGEDRRAVQRRGHDQLRKSVQDLLIEARARI